MPRKNLEIEQIKEKAIPILRNYPVGKAILFGLYEKGEATNDSDIDLYIESYYLKTLLRRVLWRRINCLHWR